jgi:hypothetical protein
MAGLRAPEPNEALTAIRRRGTVNSWSVGPPPRVNINLGGDTANPMDVPFLDSYIPSIGDEVVTASVGGDHIVIGSLAQDDTVAFEGRFDDNASHTITSNSNIAWNTLDDPWGGWNATNKNWVVPALCEGRYHVSGQLKYNTATNMTIKILVNGAAVRFGGTAASVAAQAGIIGGTLLRLAVGDTVSMQALVGSTTANEGAGIANSWLSLHRIGS